MVNDPPLPPELARMVAAARSQPVVSTCVTVEAVTAGLDHQRRRQQARRTLATSAVAAMAAAVAAVALLGPLLRDEPHQGLVAAHTDAAAAQVEPPAFVTIPHVHRPTLADAVRLRSTTPVEVRGPWAIGLRDGTHEIEVDPGAGQPLTIALPGRTLELVEGRVTVEWPAATAAGAEPAVRLHTGVAAWIVEDGSRTQIRVDRVDLGAADPAPSQPSISAAELASRAEQLLAAGKRSEAIAVYQQLVRKYPRASQTRAALLDLGRLLRVEGREAEARCAYQAYLERWPDSSVRGEVQAQLTRLGPGPSCPKR